MRNGLVLGVLAAALASGHAVAQDEQHREVDANYCHQLYDNQPEGLAACLKIVADSTKQPEPPPPQTILDWADQNVEASNWVRAAVSDSTAFYMKRSTKTKTGYVRAWVRLEYRVPPNGSKSALAYEEFDCVQHRIRVLQSTVYPGQNLSGGAGNQDLRVAAWAFNGPETVGEELERFACSHAH